MCGIYGMISLTEHPLKRADLLARMGTSLRHRGPDHSGALRSTHAAIGVERLNIIDHGNPDGVEIGSDWITEEKLPKFKPLLQKLRVHFHSKGFVHMQHCEVGKNRKVLAEFSAIFLLNPPVSAGGMLDLSFFR